MLHASPLGRQVSQPHTYRPDLLYPIPRHLGRHACNLDAERVACGVDLWTAYEMSWLNARGVPVVAIIQFCLPATSPNIIESKSFKLYLNSFSDTRFASPEVVVQTLTADLTRVAGAPWDVQRLSMPEMMRLAPMAGQCIDDVAIADPSFLRNAGYLQAQGAVVEETLYSDLLKSNCPVTAQPDWASLQVRYRGQQISREGLLRYILSYRNHTGFHELCVEQIYSDILQRCAPTSLSVYARYTRRGGIDINPFRSNFESTPQNIRTYRQ